MWVIGAGFLAVLYGALQTASLLRASPGNAKMQEIAAAIQEGAQAYLKQANTQRSAWSAWSILIAALYFLIGPLCGRSGFADRVRSCRGPRASPGMLISVRANVRTAQASSEGLAKGLSLAFTIRAPSPACWWRGSPLIGVAGYYAILTGPQGLAP